MSHLLNINSISQVHEFFGMPRPKHPLISVLRLKQYLPDIDFGDTKYILNLYQVSFKSKVDGSFNYGRNTYDFQDGTLLFTAPGQALKFEAPEVPDEEGWTLIFHPDLIRKSELGRNMDSYTFFAYDLHEALHISDEEKRKLKELVENIEKEYSQNYDKHSQKLIIANLELLLDYCTRYYDRQFLMRTNLNSDLVSGFERLLKDYYKEGQQYETGIPTVSYCSSELGYSSDYFSDLIKKETGKTAQETIQQFVIEKAKTKLLSSTDAVSQIAYDIGFEYPQHFSKLFKSKTGKSPKEYRQLN